ncbi:MAG: TonB-dependent receptor [Deltaproteobacteria bacterium]|nr:TonB-dependent receptor [Deltaproteobacteria bacterium]MBW2361265.1 TonB-dependent receptor [Deltaproteobacteria bacterium]
MAASLTRRAETAEGILRTLCILLTATLLAFGTPAGAETPDDDAASAAAAVPDTRPIQDIGKVSITATRGERDPMQVAGNVTVLDRAQIEATGARSIPDLLRRQTGLFVTSTTSNPAGVQVEARGFNNGGALGSSLLVQVDGRRVNEADTGNTDWSLIPLDQIEAIEIVRGPVSAIYGDNAVGGVINIRTLPQQGPLRVTGRGRIGRYDTYDGSVRATGTLGNVTGSLLYSGYDTDGYRDRSTFDHERVDASVEYAGNSFAVGAKGGYDDNDREFPGALDPLELAGPRGRRGADPDSVGDESAVEAYYVQAWMEYFLSDDIQLRLEPFYNHRTDDVLISTATSGQFDIQTEKRSAGVNAQLRVDRQIHGHENRFLAGFEFLYNDVETESTFISIFGPSTLLIDSERELYSGYVQEEFSVNEDILLSGGVRIDRARYDIETLSVGGSPDRARPDFTLWSPRASITYRFVECLSGYLSYSRGFRLPNFDEDAPFFGSVPDLDEQISDSLEVGLKARSERVSGGLSFYWMWVEDEILFDPMNFSNTNLERVRHRGIEASIDVAVFEWLSVYANYTLDDVRITRESDSQFRGHRMPLTPLHRGTVGATAWLPYSFEINANLNLVGSRKLANDFGGDLRDLPRYEVLDLFFAWRPKITEHISGELTLGLYNVANEKYNGFGASLTPFSGPFASVPTRFVNPAVKRTWQVGLSFTVTL